MADKQLIVTAEQKVIAIPELLEHILSSTSAIDIVRARRTCVLFKNTIDHSPVLRKRLFFVADAGIQPAPWSLNARAMPVERYVFNPILVKPLPQATDLSSTATASLTMHAFPNVVSNITTRPSVAYCSRMLLTQPPIQEIDFTLQVGSAQHHRLHCLITNPRGIKYGDIVNAIERGTTVCRMGYHGGLPERAWEPEDCFRDCRGSGGGAGGRCLR